MNPLHETIYNSIRTDPLSMLSGLPVSSEVNYRLVRDLKLPLGATLGKLEFLLRTDLIWKKEGPFHILK